MSGTPMEETKKASEKFIDTISNDDTGIGIVTYDNSAETVSNFSNNKSQLENSMSSIDSGGSTNIEEGLSTSYAMLQNTKSTKKAIVLMSDGEPNEGKTGDDLVEYANQIKKEGITIYTLGFFESLSDKSSAQSLMEDLASDGCHYEVSDADNLVYFFGDIADQINGQKYIYVRIACPVDVEISFNDEKLSSKDSTLNTRTAFGSLTFEDSKKSDSESDDENSSDKSDKDKIKTIRLKEGNEYDISISGTGYGTMDYKIGFMDENGDYKDFRKFKNVRINRKTEIDTVAKRSNDTILKVDEDGDGKYDLKYKAGANELGKVVDYKYIIYISIGAFLIILLLIAFAVIKKKRKKKNI